MYVLRTRHTGQEYLTIWWIGCITFLTSILISLALHATVVPVIERLEMMKLPLGPLVFVPFSLQICFCFLFTAGLSAIVSLCRRRQAPLSLFFLGSLPLLVVFLLYALPQGMFDLHWNNSREWDSLRVLLFAPHVLLVTSSFFFVLSTIVLLRKLWVEQRMPTDSKIG